MYKFQTGITPGCETYLLVLGLLLVADKYQTSVFC